MQCWPIRVELLAIQKFQLIDYPEHDLRNNHSGFFAYFTFQLIKVNRYVFVHSAGTD